MILFGHPIHPMTVHFPIAFYLLGVALSLLYLWRQEAEYEKFAYWSFVLSWFSTIFTTLLGLIDQTQLEVSDPRLSVVNNHITAAILFLIINGLLIYIRFRWQEVLSHKKQKKYALYWGLMGLGLVTVLITAWIGGELVYRLQIGIQPL